MLWDEPNPGLDGLEMYKILLFNFSKDLNRVFGELSTKKRKTFTRVLKNDFIQSLTILMLLLYKTIEAVILIFSIKTFFEISLQTNNI